MHTRDRIDLDDTCTWNKHAYSYARIIRIGDHRVRARVTRNYYEHHSDAVVEVLADDMTWTHLATAPTADWHPRTRPTTDYRNGPIDVITELGETVENLLNRATAILA